MTPSGLVTALVIGMGLSLPLMAQTTAKEVAEAEEEPRLFWPEGPSPEYFTGIYARVGRGGGEDPALINDLVLIRPGADGLSLEVAQCAGSDATGAGADLAPLMLVHTSFAEVGNMLVAGGQPEPFEGELWCQYYNDAGNYATLSCGNEAGVRFTLWAEPDRAVDECKVTD